MSRYAHNDPLPCSFALGPLGPFTSFSTSLPHAVSSPCRVTLRLPFLFLFWVARPVALFLCVVVDTSCSRCHAFCTYFSYRVVIWSPFCWVVFVVAPSCDHALYGFLFFSGLPIRSPFSLRGRRYILFALTGTLYILQLLCCHLVAIFYWVVVLVAPTCDHALNGFFCFSGLPVRSPLFLRGHRFNLFALPCMLDILQLLCCHLVAILLGCCSSRPVV